MASFKLEIFSPAGKAFEAEADEVYLPSAAGQIGVLPGHAGYTGLLSTGVMWFSQPNDGGTTKLVINGGFCTFEEGTLRILADQVDIPSDYDPAKLQQLEEKLPELRGTLEAHSLDDGEWQDAKREIERIEAIKSLASH